MEDFKSVLVIVEGEPIGKGRAKASSVGGFVRMYTPAKTRQYEDRIRTEATASMNGRDPFARPCLLELDLVFEVPASYSKLKRAKCLSGEIRPTKKPDVDNVLKAVCDSFNGVVWTDDVMATDFTIRKRFGETAYVQAVVTPLCAEPIR